MVQPELTTKFNEILADLTKNQVVTSYISQHPGFGQHADIPDHDKLHDAMQDMVNAAHMAARLNAWPEGSKLGHLDDIVSAIGWLSEQSQGQFKGESAKLFNDDFIKNPKNRVFAQELEFALSALEKQSPETWEHIQNHTALTMLYFERQCTAEDHVRGAKAGTAFQERHEEALQLLLGALGHDIGKVALAPELLHKATRIDTQHMDAAIAEYEKSTPGYPEKAHDIAFLRSANEGKIIFAAERDRVKFPEATLILDVGANYTHGEMALTDEQQRQRHSAIWERINEQASQHKVAHWISSEEQKALTMAKRGTVTDHEMAIIATHDEMSEEFLKAASVPDRFKAVTHIVSMDRFRQGKGPQPTLTEDEAKLANIVHATDVLEALLAPRSYRAALPAEQAIKIMNDDAAKGMLNGVTIEHMVRNGTLEIYKPRTPAIPKDFAALTSKDTMAYSPALAVASYYTASMAI